MISTKPYYAGYLLVMNLVAFILMGTDKKRARRQRWRIPEATLLATAALGGAGGAWLGMYLFRHKTKHLRFVLLVPLFALVWTIATGLLFAFAFG